MLRRFRRSDDGTAMVEFALVFLLLLMIAIGAFEWGVAFQDRIAVTQATREAGRLGSAAGDEPDADCRILEAAAGALSAISGNQIKELWIYESDVNGTVGANRMTYRPSLPGDNPANLRCTGGSWYITPPISWASTIRDNDGVTRDWLGIKIILDHTWKTNFLWFNGSVQWEEDAVFHLEPDAF